MSLGPYHQDDGELHCDLCRYEHTCVECLREVGRFWLDNRDRIKTFSLDLEGWCEKHGSTGRTRMIGCPVHGAIMIWWPRPKVQETLF